MKELSNITIICVECHETGRAISALKKSLQQINPFKAVLLTDTNISIEGIDVVLIDKITSKEQYSEFIIRELYKYFDTDYCLLIQHDGYVLNGEAWEDIFYDYDYIGAKWLFPDGRNVGNGGFSLRSLKFQIAIANDINIEVFHPEDEVIARLYRKYLEQQYNLKYAPEDVADKFSFELNEPTQKTFGFHANFWQPFKDHVIIRRWNAMGDLVMAEPLIQYYHDKGYQVVLDTLPEMMPVFFNHPYKIKHISEMNPNIKPVKVINLDMSYESKPKQSVLKTYYEFAGIMDGEMRNSKLYVNQESHQRLFQKYIVFHNSDTGMPYRNAYGVNWDFVTQYFNRLGYTCIQVSGGEPVGIHFNAETKPMLMYLLKGASAVCAIDSGVAQLSVALGIPTAIMTGSVDLKLRYNDFSKIEVIKNACPKPELEYCYHNAESSITGSKCAIDEKQPPCTQFSEWRIIGALNKLLNNK